MLATRGRSPTNYLTRLDPPSTAQGMGPTAWGWALGRSGGIANLLRYSGQHRPRSKSTLSVEITFIKKKISQQLLDLVIYFNE